MPPEPSRRTTSQRPIIWPPVGDSVVAPMPFCVCDADTTACGAVNCVGAFDDAGEASASRFLPPVIMPTMTSTSPNTAPPAPPASSATGGLVATAVGLT